MKRVVNGTQNVLLGLALSGALLPASQTYAETSGATIDQFTSFPVIVTESATPLVMLAMSKDHQYWFKAYNDYTDLDEDGDIETAYEHDFDYFGYFDQNQCYTYSTGSQRFVPQYHSDTKYCDDSAAEWSGNFLNWATMTRMDVVRKILYGGKRYADTNSLTVLERANLPTDAHAFAKHYDGNDLDRLTPFDVDTRSEVDDDDDLDDLQEIGLTICNATRPDDSSDESHNTDAPPLIRVAEGNFSLWSANERWQCQWYEERNGTAFGSQPGSNGNLPDTSGIPADAENPERDDDGLGERDYIARVEVCSDPSLIRPENNEGCKRYPDGNRKPIGLIQQYGEDELIHFGLMTGSYENNISGGVLRKNVGDIDDEINVATDGTFTGADGIIATLDAIRMYGYRYNNGTYQGSEGDDCTFQLASITEGDCTSWGNPISELYLEAIRYFAGLDPTPAFELPGGGDRLGLPKVGWQDPLSETNACSRLNTLTFNASVSSYDNDQMDGSDLPDSPNFVSLTDVIGDTEGFTGNDFFIGRNGTDNDEFCSPKSLNGLGSALGLCPEAPTVLGSYLMTGAGHYAHTNDIRDDLGGDQMVDAFAVALSTSVPKIEIPVPGQDPVTILPAYRLVHNDGGGSLVDFKIVEKHRETSSGVYEGKFYVNWEDSEQGGDYDQDMWGIIRYRLDTNTSPATIEVFTDSIAQSTANGQLFGFVISGTTQDGFHAYSGILGGEFEDPDPTIPDCNDEPNDGDCDANDPERSHVFTVGEGSAELLPDPLFLAAKWGGFEDENDNDIPDLQSEWDRKDTDGNLVSGGDGQPDNYFFVTNPAALAQSLTQVFEAIIERTASGTAAAVVANTQTGLGAAFQALYEPTRQDAAKNEVQWIGTLHALWIDEFGLLREDNPGGSPNGQLDDYNTDPVVDIFFDETEKKTKLRRFTSSDDDEFIEASSTVEPISELSPIWNAREQLSPEPDFADVTSQRTYSLPAEQGRHIITWIDADLDGEVDDAEQIDFTSSNIDSSNFGNFDVATVGEAQNLVDFTRGDELPGLRNRTLDYDGDGDLEVMRLGDIVHSTPTPVGPPAEAFDILLGDLSYADFRQQYAQRRQVVLVGANDGLLHAFNAGFFDAADKEFELSPNGETAHPLGAELWAYAPRNLLPHLKWLKDPDYTHVYYVDQKPRVFDAKIFPDDATHPGGWGTVAVVGFRLGGGDILTDTDGDGLGANNADNDDADDETMRSAYVVLDITDPEQPPEVLAELTHESMGRTTSFPSVVLFGPDNKWYLVFGSGPTELGPVTSTQDARLFAYEMQASGTGTDISLVPGFPRTLADSNAFVGDPLTVDWTFNGDADTLYFGVTDGDAADPGGRLYKLDVSGVSDASKWATEQVMIDPSPGQPFLTQPIASLDEKAQRWVFASTGRFFINADRSSTPQESLYGVIDGAPNSFPIDGSGLVDVSDAQVFADGSVQNVSDPGGGSDPDTLTELTTVVEENGGWRLDYDADGTNPSQRGVTGSALVGGILFNPAFTPSTDLCGAEGSSELFGLFFKTGTALDSPAVFGTTCTTGGDSCPESELESVRSVSLGAGLASAPSIHAGSGLGEQKVTVVEQTSTGAIVLEEATTTGGIQSAEISWREFK